MGHARRPDRQRRITANVPVIVDGFLAPAAAATGGVAERTGGVLVIGDMGIAFWIQGDGCVGAGVEGGVDRVDVLDHPGVLALGGVTDDGVLEPKGEPAQVWIAGPIEDG